jgi:hypothetical protein
MSPPSIRLRVLHQEPFARFLLRDATKHLPGGIPLLAVPFILSPEAAVDFILRIPTFLTNKQTKNKLRCVGFEVFHGSDYEVFRPQRRSRPHSKAERKYLSLGEVTQVKFVLCCAVP